jgi:hypothetical protein
MTSPGLKPRQLEDDLSNAVGTKRRASAQNEQVNIPNKKTGFEIRKNRTTTC